VERCSGRTRAGWPRFYVSPVNPMPGGLLGFYAPDRQAIIFALGQEANRVTIAHEILHWLLDPLVLPYRLEDETVEQFIERVHPPTYYGADGRCAALLHPTDPNG
jgi:hypothetical protein